MMDNERHSKLFGLVLLSGTCVLIVWFWCFVVPGWFSSPPVVSAQQLGMLQLEQVYGISRIKVLDGNKFDVMIFPRREHTDSTRHLVMLWGIESTPLEAKKQVVDLLNSCRSAYFVPKARMPVDQGGAWVSELYVRYGEDDVNLALWLQERQLVYR